MNPKNPYLAIAREVAPDHPDHEALVVIARELGGTLGGYDRGAVAGLVREAAAFIAQNPTTANTLARWELGGRDIYA